MKSHSSCWDPNSMHESLVFMNTATYAMTSRCKDSVFARTWRLMDGAHGVGSTPVPRWEEQKRPSERKRFKRTFLRVSEGKLQDAAQDRRHRPCLVCLSHGCYLKAGIRFLGGRKRDPLRGCQLRSGGSMLRLQLGRRGRRRVFRLAFIRGEERLPVSP